MNRRGFFGAGLVGLGGFFFPQKVRAAENDQWWEEKDFMFEGIPGTEFLWPTDRIVLLEQLEKDKRGRMQTVMVPTFSLLTVNAGVEQNIRDAVSAHKDSEGAKYVRSHVHLIRVKGKPNEVGILLHSTKCRVVTDFWANSELNERQMLEHNKIGN